MSLVTTLVHVIDQPVAASLGDGGSVFTPLRLVGRLHPVFVHFPIAFAFAAAAVEVWRGVCRERGMSPLTPGLLTAAAATGAVTVATGWFNADWEYAREGGDSLFWHRWLGVGATLLLAVVARWAWRSRRDDVLGSAQVAARMGAVVCAVAIAATGHLGGELVRGEGYVQEGLFSRERPSRSGAATIDVAGVDDSRVRFFLEHVQPVLADRCTECHGPRKQKGGLRLDPIEAALGDVDEPTIVPGRPDDSELLVRVLLPADDADAMPPDGDRLRPEEIEAIRRWIAEGAPIPVSALGEDEVREAGASAPRVDDRALGAARARGAAVTAEHAGSTLLVVNCSVASEPWGDADLALLAPIAGAVVELNLARSRVTDEGLRRIPLMAELRSIRLDATALSDVGISSLLLHPRLESVSLVETSVTDASLETLARHPTLRRAFVADTAVTAAAVAFLGLSNDRLEILGADATPTPTPTPVPTTANETP